MFLLIFVKMGALVLCFEGGVEVSKGSAARKKANYRLFERKPLRVLRRKSVAISRRDENGERACAKVGWSRRRMAKAKRPKGWKIRNDRERQSRLAARADATWRYCSEATRPRISINNRKAALTSTTIRRLSFRASLPPPPSVGSASAPRGCAHVGTIDCVCQAFTPGRENRRIDKFDAAHPRLRGRGRSPSAPSIYILLSSSSFLPTPHPPTPSSSSSSSSSSFLSPGHPSSFLLPFLFLSFIFYCYFFLYSRAKDEAPRYAR